MPHSISAAVQAELRELPFDAQWAVAAVGMEGHILLRVAFVVDESALDEFGDHALHGLERIALGRELVGEFPRTEIPP